ncbi:MAG: DUF1015 domain-containing protein [Planctomycetota bacterium]|jgi:uncharacterized protein (DUF1015 family)
MMEVKPFKAFRFNPDVVGDVGNCVAPPYDVIDQNQQQQLYRKSRYNIVRVIKGKASSFDNDRNNQYTRAADHLNKWIKKGVLKQDKSEAIYAYIQDFQLAGNRFQRSSFIALARLQEYGKTVRPHERTLEAPKIDRLNLKRATVTKFGLVFMLYEDKEKIADKIIEKAATQKPLIDLVDEQSVRHRLLAITAENDINEIAKMMSDKCCIIADGHHRYETALSYYEETSNPAAAYQMTAFVNVCNEGLLILATHRLVDNIQNFHFENLIKDLKKNFQIAQYSFDSAKAKTEARRKMSEQMKAEQALQQSAFGIYGGNNAFYVAVLKDKKKMDSIAPNMSGPWRLLDVSVLHKLILEEFLGINEEKLAAGGYIEYIKDTDNAFEQSIRRVDSGEEQIVFFMNPVKIQQVKSVTALGEMMPQKSTYFYPKMYTGLTINKL